MNRILHGFLRIFPLLLITGIVSLLVLVLTNYSISENTLSISLCPAITSLLFLSLEQNPVSFTNASSLVQILPLNFLLPLY